MGVIMDVTLEVTVKVKSHIIVFPKYDYLLVDKTFLVSILYSTSSADNFGLEAYFNIESESQGQLEIPNGFLKYDLLFQTTLSWSVSCTVKVRKTILVWKANFDLNFIF